MKQQQFLAQISPCWSSCAFPGISAANWMQEPPNPDADSKICLSNPPPHFPSACLSFRKWNFKRLIFVVTQFWWKKVNFLRHLGLLELLFHTKIYFFCPNFQPGCPNFPFLAQNSLILDPQILLFGFKFPIFWPKISTLGQNPAPRNLLLPPGCHPTPKERNTFTSSQIVCLQVTP